MQLDDLDFSDDLALLLHMQQQMHKMTSVAAASATVHLNIHEGRSKILRYNTACNNRITLDEEDLEDVKTITYLGSIINEYGGFDADVMRGWESKSSIFTTEENLEVKTTVNQHKRQTFQYNNQDCSTVWDRNLENYKSHHLEDTGVY
ncbi:unnamed protein product [Schistosoma curassoni]|uniref:Reverse transcriptase domain-containing protein n=1 Tax=Schistosoma curassoni TaxID=6186 RepID=A0A183KW52_9TREM|nr:unnamed protein product [Schistosoma curassoni]